MGEMENNKRAERSRLIGELYAKYERELFNYAKGLLYDAYRAEDMVHLTFLNLLENADRLEMNNDRKIRALLFKILRNLCYNEKRNNKKYKYSAYERYVNAHDQRNPAYEHIVFDELLEELRQIDESYVDILLYKSFCGMKSSEIAEIMGISAETVRKRLSRARIIIKKKLGE